MNATMRHRTLYVTEADRSAIRRLLAARSPGNQNGAALARLREELDVAVIVRANEIPPDVVTLNSRVRVRDLDTGAVAEYTLVLPSKADIAQGKVSVLAPVGTALLGQQVQDVVEWAVPAGRRRLSVDAVLYQPESSGSTESRTAA